MREIEQRAAESGLTPQVLMENAGLAVAQEIRKWLGRVEERLILVLVGPGNNGGDGLVTARYLQKWGAKVHLYLCSPRQDSDPNYRLAKECDIPSMLATEDEGLIGFGRVLSVAEVVVDAVFGSGKTRPLEGVFKQICERTRRAKESHPLLRIIALDLPSGLNPDTGVADAACLSADITVTLAYPKLGLLSFPGAEKVGKLVVADIGIPAKLASEISIELLTSEWARSVLPPRPLNANKGTFGKVLVVAGSINYIGAVYLACAAATRVGAGLVTLATPHSLQPILATKLTEVVYLPLPESQPGIIAGGASGVIREQLPNYNAVLIGCGLGQHPSVAEFLSSLLLSLPTLSLPSIVLDADALNFLATVPQWWHQLTPETIITPHPGEMSRLTGFSNSEIQRDRLGIALKAASLWQKTVVLKGAHTVITAPDGKAKVSLVANPGLASAGTGDVLAGAIAGLLAQGLSLFDAAASGVYLHGEAGEMAKEELGNTGMIASDLLIHLPKVIKNLKERKTSIICGLKG